MRVMAVDLAAKMSAFVMLNADEVSLAQGHSWNQDPGRWVETCIAKAQGASLLLIEDMPHGVRYNPVTKLAIRMQGRFLQAAETLSAGTEIALVQPGTWKGWYKLTGKDSGARIMPLAIEHGWVPPVNINDYHGLDRTRARKANTDYAAAWMMARWAMSLELSLPHVGVERVR